MRLATMFIQNLKCLHLLSHTYSQIWSCTCLIHCEFWWNGYIDFQRFASLRCFVAGFVCNVYVGFEIWVCWSCFSSMYMSVFAHIQSKLKFHLLDSLWILVKWCCLQCLRCFWHTYSWNWSLVKLFVYNVYVRFRTHIVEIEVLLAWFTLDFGEMVLSTMSTLISRGSPVWDILVQDLSTMSTLFLTHI